MKERFATYRTFVVDDGGAFLIRGDQQGRFILEGDDVNMRLLWDGAHLTLDNDQLRQPDEPAQTFGPAVDALVAAAVAEARAGFPNTRFFDEAPSSAGYTREAPLEPNQLWRRVDLPGTSDDAVKIFVDISKVSGDVDALYVLGGKGEPIGLPPPLLRAYFVFGKWSWDVPIQDDLDRPEQWLSTDVIADPYKWANQTVEGGGELDPEMERFAPYHLRFNRYAPPFRPELSTGSVPPPPAPSVESALAVWEGTCTKKAVHTVAFHWVWRSDPTALDWQGVPAAVAGGCPIRVEMHPRARSELAPGSKTRISATFQVSDVSGGPVATTPVSLSRNGPGKDQSDLSLVVPIALADPSRLELVFDGTATLTCGAADSSLVQVVGLADLDDRTLPRLRWDGCMPEPPPRE